jgi:hypothetical protein
MKEINYANCMIRKCEQCRYYEYCFKYKVKKKGGNYHASKGNR